MLSKALLGFSVPDNQSSMTAHYKGKMHPHGNVSSQKCSVWPLWRLWGSIQADQGGSRDPQGACESASLGSSPPGAAHMGVCRKNGSQNVSLCRPDFGSSPSTLCFAIAIRNFVRRDKRLAPWFKSMSWCHKKPSTRFFRSLQRAKTEQSEGIDTL